MSENAFRILVAEDHLGMGNVIQFTLKKAGFEVTLARDGRAAWEQLQKQSFDLVISDYQMPGMNGGQLRERMCQDSQLAQVPYVLLTAKGLELEADYYRDELHVLEIISKPFSPRALMVRVGEIASECTAATVS